PARAVPVAVLAGADRGVVPVAEADPAPRAAGVRGEHSLDRGDACLRGRGEGIAALDHFAWRQHPGLRIRKTRFRGDGGVAVCGIDQAAGNAVDVDGDRAVAEAGAAAGDGTGL